MGAWFHKRGQYIRECGFIEMGAWFHRRGHSTSGREEGPGNEMGAWFHRDGGLVS